MGGLLAGKKGLMALANRRADGGVPILPDLLSPSGIDTKISGTWAGSNTR